MNKEPLISSEVFDYLRNLAIEPYTKLSDIAREQLGDGVRLVSLFPGESSLPTSRACASPYCPARFASNPPGLIST